MRLRLRPRLCLQAGRDRRERSVMLLFYSNPILSNIKDLEYLFPIQMGGVVDLQLPESIEAGEPRPVGRPVTFFKIRRSVKHCNNALYAYLEVQTWD